MAERVFADYYDCDRYVWVEKYQIIFLSSRQIELEEHPQKSID